MAKIVIFFMRKSFASSDLYIPRKSLNSNWTKTGKQQPANLFHSEWSQNRDIKKDWWMCRQTYQAWKSELELTYSHVNQFELFCLGLWRTEVSLIKSCFDINSELIFFPCICKVLSECSSNKTRFRKSLSCYLWRETGFLSSKGVGALKGLFEFWFKYLRRVFLLAFGVSTNFDQYPGQVEESSEGCFHKKL